MDSSPDDAPKTKAEKKFSNSPDFAKAEIRGRIIHSVDGTALSSTLVRTGTRPTRRGWQTPSRGSAIWPTATKVPVKARVAGKDPMRVDGGLTW